MADGVLGRGLGAGRWQSVQDPDLYCYAMWLWACKDERRTLTSIFEWRTASGERRLGEEDQMRYVLEYRNAIQST